MERRLTATMAAIVGGDLSLRVLHYFDVVTNIEAVALMAVATVVPLVLLAAHVGKEEGRSVVDVLRHPGRGSS